MTLCSHEIQSCLKHSMFFPKSISDSTAFEKEFGAHILVYGSTHAGKMSHEIVRQAKRVQRLADERVNGGGIVVMLDAAKGGDAGGIGLSVGVHSFFSANRAARIFSPNTRRVKCRRNRSRSPASSVRPRKPSSRSAIWPGDFVSTSPS